MPLEDLMASLDNEKSQSISTVSSLDQAQLLRGGPVVTKIHTWCTDHNKNRRGPKPTLAVVYFDTGNDADEYLYIKRIVAERVSRLGMISILQLTCISRQA